MHTTGFGGGFAFFMILHMVAMLAVTVGILFLLFWAFKHLTSAELKKWGWTLVIGGAVVCLLTISMMGRPFAGHYKGGLNGVGMMGGAEGKTMRGMTMMLEGKTGTDFDQAFLQMMIPHHKGAIDMAEQALQSAGHAELKAMANSIITSQQREIDQMKQWQAAWGAGQ